MLGLIVILLLPTYYLAKSKGYNVAVVLVISAIISAIPMMIRMANDDLIYPFFDVTVPLLVLLAVWLLPQKEGAPGKAYLKISFNCPECKESVTFERRFEGKAELCPKCGEIITVPLDEFSPKPKEQKKTKPDLSEGQVCFAEFGNEMAAIQLVAMLEDNGIKTDMISGIGGGALPQLGGTQGFKVTIDVNDWDAAIEIEKTANQSTHSITASGGSE